VSDEVRAEDQLDPVLGQQRRTVEALQTFARGLHPRELTTAGLAGALSSLAKASGIPTVVNVAAGRLPPEIEAPIYFCSVEAVANANKHSGARSIEIRIAGAGNRVTAEVVDDGVGGADAVRGSGLRGLADRIAALDGTFIVTDRPGGGTIVSIGLPLTRRSTGPDTGEPVSRS